MNHTALKHLHMRPIAYYPVYAYMTGSVTGGVVLSQILYWAARSDREFFKTDEELAKETGCSFKEIRSAKKMLRNLPFLHVQVKGVPARTYYSVDWDALVNSLAETNVEFSSLPEPGEPDCPNQANQFDQNGQTSLTKRDKLVCPNQANCTIDSSIDTRVCSTETTTENKNITYVFACANEEKKEAPNHVERKAKVREQQLRLKLETTLPDKPPKVNYYREIAHVAREVGENLDAGDVQQLLRTWKILRTGDAQAGIPGLSVEEIAETCRKAKTKANGDCSLAFLVRNWSTAKKIANMGKPQSETRSYQHDVAADPLFNEWLARHIQAK